MSEFNYYIKTDYKALLQNGDDFLEAAWRCAGRDESGKLIIMTGNRLSMIPAATVVNAAFSIEMYLKSLLLFTGIDYPTDKNGHNILYLFKLLPDAIKTKINWFCSGKKHEKPSFENFAEKHSKDFIDVRYYVTKTGWQGMDPLIVLMYAFHLSQATKLIVKNMI